MLDFEHTWNTLAATPPDLPSAIAALSPGELRFLGERAAAFAASRHPGMASFGEALWMATEIERARRDRDTALTRARFDTIVAREMYPEL